MDCKKNNHYTNQKSGRVNRTLMHERRYRSVNTVKKYAATIQAKKYIIKQKLAAIAKELAALKAKATADLITMMMAMMSIKKTKIKTILEKNM